MRELKLENIGKRYSSRWIFRQMNHRIAAGTQTAVVGKNGSGKSTLLQIISGFITPSEGKVTLAGTEFGTDQIAFSASYMDLPEELTLYELIRFYFQFKRKNHGQTTDAIFESGGLQVAMHQPLRAFSSGMKQKVKLALTFLTDAEIYLFDEPCAHLDDQSVNWYQLQLKLLPASSFVFIGSNSVAVEMGTCTYTIKLD